MKVAITGGTGFIGRPLVEALAKAGHPVVVLSRHPETVLGLPSGVTSAAFDAHGPLPPENLGGAEAVVNLAGENLAQRWTAEARKRIVESRVEGTRRLIEAAQAAGTVRAFVSASAVGYYGSRGAEPLTEASAPGGDFLAQVCREWEAAAQPPGNGKWRTVIARFGVVLHPEGGALAKMLPLFRAGLGGRLGKGDQYMSWIHREDVVRMIRWMLEREDLSGPYNATAPEPVTNREFTRALGKALRRPAVLPAPSLALRAVLGEMSSTVLTGQRVLPERARQAGFVFEYPDLDQALEDLVGSGRPV